jgi:pilus assembly protein CpaF
MMVLMGMDLPLGAIRKQIASGVDIIVHLGRLRDKSRRVLAIAEVDKMVDGEIVLNPLYAFEEESVKDGKIVGKLAPRNPLCHADKLKAAGMEL